MGVRFYFLFFSLIQINQENPKLQSKAWRNDDISFGYSCTGKGLNSKNEESYVPAYATGNHSTLRTISWYWTHGSKQLINQPIKEEYKIWGLAAEAYDYVVQFRPYQSEKKGKQFASSTKWGLGKNVVLLLMECLTPTFGFDTAMGSCLLAYPLCS